MQDNATEKAWADLQSRCENCTNCPLHANKTHTVFGKGSRTARILFVGEAPGEQEDLQGLPFVGASGQLLDRYLAAVDIGPEEYYIGNILKCRPPHNRDPLPEEQDACIGYLREQLKLLDPQIIVCLGRIAAMRIIKPDFRITKEHGKWFKKGKYHITAVYHPSLLLRDPSKREEMLMDFLSIEKTAKELFEQGKKHTEKEES